MGIPELIPLVFFFFLFNSMLFGKKPNSAGMAVPEEPSQPLGRGLLTPW